MFPLRGTSPCVILAEYNQGPQIVVPAPKASITTDRRSCSHQDQAYTL